MGGYAFSDTVGSGVPEVFGDVRISPIGVTTNIYVATTGSDASLTPTNPATPYLTIQKGIDYFAAGLFPGICIINIANGTYTEQLVFKSMQAGSANTTYGPSEVLLLATNSGMVTVNGGSGKCLTGTNVNATYKSDGVYYTNDDSGTCQFALFKNSNVFFHNLQATHCKTGLIISQNCKVVIEDGISIIDCNDIVNSIPMAATQNSVLEINGSITIQKYALRGPTCFEGGIISFNPSGAAGKTLTLTATVGAQACMQINSGGYFQAGTNSTISMANATVGFQTIGANCFARTGTSNTINFTDISIPIQLIEASGYGDGLTCTYNYLGTSTALVQRAPGSQLLSYTSCGGATITNFETDTDFSYGYDARYTDTILGRHIGALPLATTGYLTSAQISSDYIPLYIAPAARQLKNFSIKTAVSNGAAHTDTYTVYVNGIATAITVSITNGSSGTDTTHTVNLAPGDSVGYFISTDAATAATNATVTLTAMAI